MTRIALPVLGGQFSSHFGGAEGFAIYEVDESTGTITGSSVHPAPPHVQGSFPAWLAQQGVDVVIAAGMGPRAVDILQANGIDVVLGATGQDPEVLVGAYLDGTLTATGESCHENGHGHGPGQWGHGHGHGGHHGSGGCH